MRTLGKRDQARGKLGFIAQSKLMRQLSRPHYLTGSSQAFSLAQERPQGNYAESSSMQTARSSSIPIHARLHASQRLRARAGELDIQRDEGVLASRPGVSWSGSDMSGLLHIH